MNQPISAPLLDAASFSACVCSDTSSLPMFQVDIVGGTYKSGERQYIRSDLECAASGGLLADEQDVDQSWLNSEFN